MRARVDVLGDLVPDPVHELLERNHAEGLEHRRYEHQEPADEELARLVNDVDQ